MIYHFSTISNESTILIVDIKTSSCDVLQNIAKLYGITMEFPCEILL